MKEYSWKNRIEVLISCIVLIIIWEIVAKNIDNDIYLPNIEQVLNNLYLIVSDNDFTTHIGASIYRSSVSFIIALIISIFTGVIAYINSLFRNFIKPINSLAQSIPTMILVVLALIWFDKDKAPFIIGFAIVFPILHDCVLNSLMGIDKNIEEMAYIYDLKLIDKIKYIYFPSIKSKLLPLLVSTFSLAFKVVIAGEVYGQPLYGIGTIIQVEKMNFNTPAIFAWIIIVALISVFLDLIQRYLLKLSFRWKRS